ncbi:MAG: Phage integrase family [Phormidesmis priestleyi Ana]|uniref:Phage integrase family n=1 Tax=Phormidesmis priestleyi Ana TaxID=1666911 RepID=A0A0N8KMT0_9CYAN|nr:MAG: Phage integrase family [Phormidesmis priestleyi Ana]
MDISEKIEQINAQLRDRKTGVTIGQRGGKLYLRATLPPKPGSKKIKASQQRISLKLPANPAGLRKAEKEARLMGELLASGEFNWARYVIPAEKKIGSCGLWLEKFEHWYINGKGGSKTTWDGDYKKALKGLPADAELSADILQALILQTKPNKRSRQRVCMAAAALAKFAGLEFDASQLRGNYSPSKVSPRNLPTDEMIARYRDTLTNQSWRWVYGVMACYGLRNHEVFRLELDDFPIVRVGSNTKTGEREVWPCYPEWAVMWRLDDRQLPPIDLTQTNEAIGRAVSAYLSPKLPFKPYDLRHCWAVRTLEFGLPDALSAQQMGHSLDVHNRTYQRWITKAHHQRVYDLLLNRPDRPRPPPL